jgi:hypothetical protein
MVVKKREQEVGAMTTAVMVPPTAVNEGEEDCPITGVDLTELLTGAGAERDIARATGVTDELEVEAVYSVETGLWTVQVFNHTRAVATSLYAAN